MTVEELFAGEIKAGEFRRNLRLLRLLRELEQKELARKAGITPTALSRLENGVTKPRKGTLKKLAAALEVSPETLAGRPR